MVDDEEEKVTGKKIMAAILIAIILFSMAIPIIIYSFSLFNIRLFLIVLSIMIIVILIIYIIHLYVNKVEKRKKIVLKEYLEGNLVDVKISKNQPIENCQICKLKIKPEHIAIQCSKCKSYFHKDHFITWFVQNSFCPVCKNENIPMNPKKDKSLN